MMLQDLIESIGDLRSPIKVFQKRLCGLLAVKKVQIKVENEVSRERGLSDKVRFVEILRERQDPNIDLQVIKRRHIKCAVHRQKHLFFGMKQFVP